MANSGSASKKAEVKSPASAKAPVSAKPLAPAKPATVAQSAVPPPARQQISNHIINQVMLIAVIVFVCLLIFFNLSYYLPGFLGAVTLYILYRNVYFKFTEQRKWHRSLTSLLMILLSIVFIVMPIWGLIDYLIPKVSELLSNAGQIETMFQQVKAYMATKPILNRIDLSDDSVVGFAQNLTRHVPGVLNSVAEVLVNLLVTFFVLYFMQVQGRKMEDIMSSFFPFSDLSKDEIWTEVNYMVRTNALGIPILGLCQGVVAIIGYSVFGVPNPILWGVATGIATIVPILGTMAVYIPICLLAFATGDLTNAIWLTLYCFILVGGIDNVLRFTIMKTLGDVHPLITVFGVLFGLKVFGMLGLIFGPLILSAVRVLFKIYRIEYGNRRRAHAEATKI